MTSRDPLQAASLSRRRLLVLSAGLAAAPAWPRGAAAAPDPADGAVAPAGEVEIHGMSGFGDLKYPADFRHFDYVNPNAPKGGAFSETVTNRQYNQNFLTFNSLNVFILRGDGARAMEATFATLMAAAEDEPDSLYGLAARKVRISADGLTYRFFIRPEARFHDGTKLTARDVAFSLNLLKDKGHPIITQQMRDVAGAEAQDDEIVTVRFAPNRARDVPLFAAGLPIFSRAYYTAHDFDQTTLDIPLGSGAYRVGRFEAGRYIEYQRVADWWGAKLPVSVGQYNFDTLRYEYYRDRDVAFEGFKAKSYLFHEEFTSRTWATGYDFPAIRDGRVKRREIPDDTPSGGQGWLFNTRRPKFANPRLREALNYAFDFEWTNKTIMYGAYLRTHSVFQNSDMMAHGLPSPGGAQTARTMARQGTGPGVRRTHRPAGVRWFGSGSRAAAQGFADAAGRRISHQRPQANGGERRADHVRVPDRRTVVPAAPHAVHQEFSRPSASMRPCASSIRCNLMPASMTSISTWLSTG